MAEGEGEKDPAAGGGSSKKKGPGATGAKKKKAVRKEGERLIVRLKKNEGESLSLAVGPGDANDYVVRGRRKLAGDARPKLTVETFANFAEASDRVDAIVSAATEKGWTKEEKSSSIDDLL
jgi:hypothetical protein